MRKIVSGLAISLFCLSMAVAGESKLPDHVEKVDHLEYMLLVSQEREMSAKIQVLSSELEKLTKAREDKAKALAAKYRLEQGDEWDRNTLEIKRAKK